MDESRRRAWEALELGPLWRLRDQTAPAAEAPPSPEPVPGAAQTADPSPTAPAAPGRLEVQTSAVQPDAVANLSWEPLRERVLGCTACPLSASRRHAVFGVGTSPAPWMIVGEAPGQQEDERGEPFVGPAGQLLDHMLAAIGVDRAREVFITNVLKCRPPGNRDPQPDEVACCEPYLRRQVALVNPRLILVLGRFAAHSLLGTDASIASLRGRVHAFQGDAGPIPMVVTYHPAYLLRNLPDKARAWADLRLARRCFDEPASR